MVQEFVFGAAEGDSMSSNKASGKVSKTQVGNRRTEYWTK